MTDKFDLIVIGGGAAGLVSSSFAAGLGLDVALVSDGPPGGECLWSGCVPSKALIHRARIAWLLKEEGAHSTRDMFSAAVEHMRSTRAAISHHDSVETVEKGGVRVIQGRARFSSAHTIAVGDQSYSAEKFIIATGGFQSDLPIDGLKESGFRTHETILDLEDRPDSMLILGGGPVGVEYAQVMTRLGVRVTLVEYGKALIARDEPESSSFVKRILESEGCDVHLETSLVKVERQGAVKSCILRSASQERRVEVSEILVATGKTPATGGLDLERAAVDLNDRGFIITDSHMRTSARHIWACGDVAGTFQFTHYADHTARIAVMNACLGIPARREEEVVPWCIFVDPEVAHVGLTEKQADEKFGPGRIVTLRYNLSDYDRAILDGVPSGFIKAVILRNGRILGVSIAGERAGELIHEFALAMRERIPVQKLGSLIHVYPSMSGAVRNLSNLYYRHVMADTWQSRIVKLWARMRHRKYGVAVN